jgi:hypothetical protein
VKQTSNFNFCVSLTAHVGIALATERQPACAETAVAKLIAMTEAVNFIAARSIWQRMWIWSNRTRFCGFAVLLKTNVVLSLDLKILSSGGVQP